MRGGLRKWLVCAAVGLALASAGVAIARSHHSGVIGPSLGITANGRVLHPIGRMTTVGNFPTGSALTPDGRFLWVVDCGHGPDDVRILEVASGAVVQTLPLPGCYGGIAIAPDGKHAYVSGTPKGGSTPEGPTKGDPGDVIHIFSVEPSGKGVEQTPLQLPEVKGGSGRTNSLPPTKEGVGTAYPEGLAISPDGKKLVVALSDADSAVVVDLTTQAQSVVAVGHYPDGVAFDRKGRAYVSNEYDGTISVIDTTANSVTTTISGLGGALGDLASHPEGMVADPVREQLYVAVTNRDAVAVIDTESELVVKLISVARPQALGTEPVKLAVTPDGNTLFAADANEDAVAVIPLKAQRRAPAYQLLGRLPTAAYPDDVQVTPDGSQLIWVAGKGYGAGPTEGPYILDMLLGRVGVLPVPSYKQMKRLTRVANKEILPFNREPQPAGSPVPAAGQGPSQQIKHIFYIVRENRTYDQIFGADKRGEGSAKLELFGDNGEVGPSGGITPNAHALTHTAGPLLDHFYMDSEVSVDGHLIAVGGIATDYVQKETAANYSGRRETYDFGIYPVSFPPKFFIFDQAAAQGISFKDYGEAAAGLFPAGNTTNRPQYSNVLANFDTSYPNDLFIGCQQAGVEASCTQDSGFPYKGTGKKTGGQSRFNEWFPHFTEEATKGTVPTLTMMLLMSNHTNGTTPKDYTPQAMNADNDLALGQVVDAISHSSIWPSTAIFVEEDDSQDGFDHIDAHRSPALVISPWARHGAVVQQRYDQYSMLRTIELISGIAPLSLNDALATPMFGAFIGGSEKPNNAPYNVIAPTQDIGAVNPEHAAMARISAALPWNRLDAVPQELSDRILWASVHGAGSPAPPPGPNASPTEHARALGVQAALAAHR